MPTFGGANIFGVAVHVQRTPNPCARQVDSFFGSNGTVRLEGGTRGQTLRVTGVLVGTNIELLLAAESALLSFAGAPAQTLVDDAGRVFPNVVFEGEYVPSPEGIKETDWGVCLPYTATFYALT